METVVSLVLSYRTPRRGKIAETFSANLYEKILITPSHPRLVYFDIFLFNQILLSPASTPHLHHKNLCCIFGKATLYRTHKHTCPLASSPSRIHNLKQCHENSFPCAIFARFINLYTAISGVAAHVQIQRVSI